MTMTIVTKNIMLFKLNIYNKQLNKFKEKSCIY